jgi:hypothetical protein
MTSIRRGFLLTIFAAGTVAAQTSTPAQAMPARRSGNPAQLFLANTAQLQLNDQQVTRLAAIARRAEVRDQGRRAAIDSLRARWMTPATDSAARAARRMELANTMRTAMERARDERHADLRDALAVLSADQQARAWELRSSGRGLRARPARQGRVRGQMREGRGARRGDFRRGMRQPL